MDYTNKLPIRATVRPLPYYSVTGSLDHTLLAKSLRREFIPKITRRLPGHHLCGFRNDMIIGFVKKHKKTHPCFLRTDIAKFYPSIRHQDIVVNMQLAYRDLLSLDYVPKEFKRKYLGPVNAWCKSLPLNQGIPLGSPLSTILAPLMLMPLWLEIKRRFRVPFLVYMDNVLVMCENENRCAEIYAFINDRLNANYALTLNNAKTISGRFSRQRVDFCGWQFSGGYANICDHKIEAFKERISKLMQIKNADTVGFLKRLNRKIDGFGNYYKHGDTGRQFAELDTYLRREVRKWLAREKETACVTNDRLHTMGLHSLRICHEKAHRQTTVKQPVPRVIPAPTQPQNIDYDFIGQALDKLVRQLSQILDIQRKQLRIIESICI